MTTAASLDLDTLLAPRVIAVIGASPNPAGHAGRCLANLRGAGYEGVIHPVNPKYEEVDGLQAYPSITAVPGPVDTAYVLVPSRAVEGIVADCVASQVRNVVVCSSGFAEVGGQGVRAQRRLRELTRGTSTRLLGPNCIGVLSVPERYMGTPTFNITRVHVPGAITLLSHSGGMAAVAFNRAQSQGIGIRSVVSLGNEADIEMAEVVDALVDDSATSVIALFVEQLRDGERFVSAAERAREAGKPIVVLKTGRSEAGRRAAFGHTGALAGEHNVFSGVMHQLGVIEVTSIDELLTTADVLQRLPSVAGDRLGVLSPSGGETSYAADRASEAGLRLPALDAATEQRIAQLLPLGSPSNPLDVTGQVIGDRALLEEVVQVFTSDPNLDVVLYCIPTWGDYDNEALLPTLLSTAESSSTPVVISAWQARGLTERGDELLRDARVPTAPSPDLAIAALGHIARHRRRRGFDRQTTSHRASDAALVRPRTGTLTPNEHDSTAFVAATGLPVVEERLVSGPDEAAEAAEALNGPVVLKLLATGVTHKSDMGLVRVAVTGLDQVRREATELIALADWHGLRIDGLLVARYVAGTEIMVGAVHDETFGPVLLAGAGGVLAEARRDVTFRRAPFDETEADAMLSELDVDAWLQSLRGRRPDRQALCEVLARLSQVVANSPDLAELDLNPIIVRDEADGGGAFIVDAALRWHDRDTD